jgi:hypothetical protein
MDKIKAILKYGSYIIAALKAIEYFIELVEKPQNTTTLRKDVKNE